MDRFEGQSNFTLPYPLEYLHSSMDRFEAKWGRRSITSPQDLHSSMDRFEDNYRVSEVQAAKIYIPVWIDLKHHPLVFDKLKR